MASIIKAKLFRRHAHRNEATALMEHLAEEVSLPGSAPSSAPDPTPNSAPNSTSNSAPNSSSNSAPNSTSNSVRNIDVLDIDLYNDDYDLWFAKATFQYHLAMAIEKEHLGHGVINPEDVLESVEASYLKGPSQHVRHDNGFHHPESELFGKINYARKTKDVNTLNYFIQGLSSSILTSCKRLSNEKVELPAHVPANPSRISRSTTPNSSTSRVLSSEDGQEVSSAAFDLESSSQENITQNAAPSTPDGLHLPQENVAQNTASSTPDGLSQENITQNVAPSTPDGILLSLENIATPFTPGGISLSQENITQNAASSQENIVQNSAPSTPGGPSQENLAQNAAPPIPDGVPVYRYTSILYEHATRTQKQEPRYRTNKLLSDMYRCEVEFDGTQGVGEDRNSKQAKHIASQMICQTLEIA